MFPRTTVMKRRRKRRREMVATEAFILWEQLQEKRGSAGGFCWGLLG